jgi:TonB-linked SusC/RagA family outer membrane protein
MKKVLLALSFLMVFGLGSIFAQAQTVTGTVTGSEDGIPIPGVSVFVKGTTVGTVTQVDGTYSLNVPEEAEAIVFSFVGMQSQEIPFEGQSTIDVALESESIAMDEIIVVAYGEATKETFTGSAAEVNSEQLEKRQVSNISNALSGVAAGVQTASSSGQPGTSAKVRIRGMGSLSASSAPLYVVDGVPYDGDISAISTQDIESMTVLKDAASNALYGARGANGVILITTKKGRAGKTTISFEAKLGVNQRAVPEYDIMTDPGMYYEKYYEGIYNTTRGSDMTMAEANAYANETMFGSQGLEYNIYDVPEGQLLIGENGRINPNATLGRVWADDYYLTSDDWYDELFGDTNTREEYNVSISGGTEDMNVYFSANYLDDKGIIANSDFNRLTTRLKADYQAKEWLKIGGNLSYTDYQSKSPDDQEGLSSKNIFYVSRIVAPIYPLYVRDSAGDIIVDDQGHTLYDYGTGEYPGLTRPVMSIANPASDLQLDKQRYDVGVFTSRAFADIDITQDLNLKFNVGYDVDNSQYLDKGNAYYGQSADFGGNIYRYNTKTTSLNLQQLLNYKKSFGDHAFDLLLGHETYERQWNSLSGIKYDLYDPESEEISNAIVRPAVYSTSDEYYVEGYLSRLKYNLQQKYYISGSYRRDGSSRFAEDNRWGDFWSVGSSWLINKENFMAGASFVDMLKFKISYGSQGNDALLYSDGTQNYYPYQDQYVVKNSNDDFAVELDYKGNRDITWETSYNFNTGFDFALFNNKLEGSVEYFSRKVEDMLFYRPVSNSAGYSSYPDNIGSMRNRGFEFELTGILVNTPDVDWTLSVNGTHYRNEILSLPPEFSDPAGYLNGRRLWKVGGSIYDMYYPIYMGVEEGTGAALWRVTEEDGTYGTTTDYATASEKANSGNVGTTLPDLQGGVSTTVNFYGFDFSVLVSYQLGGQVYDYAYQQLMHAGEAGEAGTNWHKDILNSWSPENTNTDIPAVNYSSRDYNATSDRFVTDATHLSINNITLGYTLPRTVVERFNIGSVRIFAVADNVALFSKRKGLDPRQNYDGDTDFIYSPIRTISGGVKVNF